MKSPLVGPVPVAFFGMAVGTLAFANAWRVAVRIWELPSEFATALTVAGLLVWLAVGALYAYKWIRFTDAARAEIQDPVQSAFASLGVVGSLLAANAVQPWSHDLAAAIFVISAAVGLGLGAHQYARVWKGHLAAAQVTPISYLPGVAPNLVAGAVAAGLGWHQVGAMFFGAGVLAWLAIESIMLHRVTAHPELPAALRPALGIQLAPPVVAGGAYLSLTSGSPDVFAMVLLGYGIYQAVIFVRLLPWIAKQPFSPAYWGFSFGLAALPTLAMRMVERGATGSVEWIAIVGFVIANITIGALIVKTAGLLFRGALFPAAPAAAKVTEAVPAAAAARG